MSKTSVCYIICALPQNHSFSPKPGDLVIAADGGYAHMGGIKPDLVVGDFDSLGYVPEGEQVVRHPAEKDDTDTMLAARIGIERGYRTFLLLGGVGGRLDHTLANIQTLAFLRENGARAALIGEGETITLIQNEALRFRAGLSGIISVFSYGAVAYGVYERGLAYALTDATLTDTNPLGVSNAFTGEPAEVRVREGRLVVLFAGLPEDSDLFT
ncbi:MAG: thiamine diphosphokinase [Firmicutes bacterium HGW-Firmicutes-9]|jgi:thiamine pyrophosphokinase|nr:MAG: thiamine diphosphokinase [Firmicutes bacterium HGW-Firmicutes-9]